MKQCGFALLDTDQGILFCKHGGPCGKRLHYDDCPLVSHKEEKSFEIGQRVRIVGPTTDGHAVYIGKCFYIDRIIGPPHQQQKEYSRKDCGCIFTASSLEPVERDPDRLEAIERRLDSIEKRLQPMEDKVVIKITDRPQGADA
jgi:hypothetical protein